MADTLLTIAEAALQLGISPSSVRNLVARGRLPSYRPLPRCVRLDPADLARFRESCRIEATAPPAWSPGLPSAPPAPWDTPRRVRGVTIPAVDWDQLAGKPRGRRRAKK
jgi:excisionase family DNA binding protein